MRTIYPDLKVGDFVTFHDKNEVHLVGAIVRVGKFRKGDDSLPRRVELIYAKGAAPRVEVIDEDRISRIERISDKNRRTHLGKWAEVGRRHGKMSPRVRNAIEILICVIREEPPSTNISGGNS